MEHTQILTPYPFGLVGLGDTHSRYAAVLVVCVLKSGDSFRSCIRYAAAVAPLFVCATLLGQLACTGRAAASPQINGYRR